MQQAPDGKVIIIIANGAIDRVFGDARHPIRVSMDESNEQRVACSLRDDLSYRSFDLLPESRLQSVQARCFHRLSAGNLSFHDSARLTLSAVFLAKGDPVRFGQSILVPSLSLPQAKR